MKRILGAVLNLLFSFCKIQKNKIVLESGRGLVDGNVEAVYHYIVKHYPDRYKLVWLVNRDTDVSNLREGDYVYYKTFKSLYHLATAHYWFRSQSIGSILKKRKGQVYIQLWHGNGGVKKMEYDITNPKERPVLDHVKEWDYYIGSAPTDADHIVTSSGYNKKIEILGQACFDKTYELSKDKDFKRRALEKLGIDYEKTVGKRLVLFAPTFRDTDLDKDESVKIPIKKFSQLKDYIFLIRLHPLVRDKVDKSLFEYDNIFNACDYPDSSELLAFVDVLITDYSSIFYQYAPLNRPMLFYAYDLEFEKSLRGGFYIDYENEVPGPVCYTEDELCDTLRNLDEVIPKYKKRHDDFNKKYNKLQDGNASKRFVEKLNNGDFDN